MKVIPETCRAHVPEKSYSRNVSCARLLISTFLLQIIVCPFVIFLLTKCCVVCPSIYGFLITKINNKGIIRSHIQTDRQCKGQEKKGQRDKDKEWLTNTTRKSTDYRTGFFFRDLEKPLHVVCFIQIKEQVGEQLVPVCMSTVC